MSRPRDRRSILAALLGLSGNLERTLTDLGTSATLGSGPSVQLGRANVLRAMDAFLGGELSADLLERWAEAVHSAEDVVLDPADEAFLSDALFELSTPELFGSIDEVVARFQDRDGDPNDL